MKKKVCSVCNEETYLWKSNPPTCKNCISKTPIKKQTEKQKIKKQERSESSKVMIGVFIDFYREHNTKCCEECGVKITELRTYNVHHVLPKHLYPELKNDTSNFMLLCQQCHSNWETLRKGDNIQKRYDELKNK
jgi:5-methylcytosine-specific restriction endonuclease McrA